MSAELGRWLELGLGLDQGRGGNRVRTTVRVVKADLIGVIVDEEGVNRSIGTGHVPHARE